MNVSKKVFIEVDDNDVATIEVLHDLLLENNYKYEHFALKRARKLIEKIYKELYNKNQ